MGNETERLKAIKEIIERVDNRAMATDGPVTPTLEEMTSDEMHKIYRLASCSPAPAPKTFEDVVREGFTGSRAVDAKTNEVEFHTMAGWVRFRVTGNTVEPVED